MDSLLHAGRHSGQAMRSGDLHQSAQVAVGVAATVAAGRARRRVLPGPPADLNGLVPPEGLEPPTRGLGIRVSPSVW